MEVVKTCEICNIVLVRRDWEKPGRFKKRVCCTRQCNARRSGNRCKGKRAHNNKQVTVICKQCGKGRLASPSLAGPFCNRKCMARWLTLNQRGAKHWNWQGGITPKLNRIGLYPGYKEWRRQVYIRDGFKCRICGASPSGQLNAHHIKPVSQFPDLVLDVSNGVTVCVTCHKGIHYGNLQANLQWN